MKSKLIKVCSIPSRSGSNPYIPSINKYLEERGVTIIHPPHTLEEITKVFDTGIILHFHWPSRLYSPKDLKDFSIKIDQWKNFLELAKVKGCYIVWTAHNLYPHETLSRYWDQEARRILVSFCDHIVVHCNYAIDSISREFGNMPDTSIIPHPSTLYELSNPSKRLAYRTRLAIKGDDIVFLSFGLMREYKNLEFAVRAFFKVKNVHAKLVIAGDVHPSYDITTLRKLSESDSRVLLLTGEVPENELSDLFASSDVALFTYSNILSSGGVAIAQSFGKAVIAPKLGCIQSMVPPEAGELYEPDSIDSLANSLERIINSDLVKTGEAGQNLILRESVESFANKLYIIYKGLIKTD